MVTLTAPRPGLDWSRVTVHTVGFVPAVCDVFTDVTYHDGPAGEYVELRLPYRQTVELVAPPTIPAPLAPLVEVEPVAATATADAAGGGTPIRGPGRESAPGLAARGALQTSIGPTDRKAFCRVRVYPLAAAC